MFGCHVSGTGNPYEKAWITEYLVGDCEQKMICINDLMLAHKKGDHATVKPFLQKSEYSY